MPTCRMCETRYKSAIEATSCCLEAKSSDRLRRMQESTTKPQVKKPEVRRTRQTTVTMRCSPLDQLAHWRQWRPDKSQSSQSGGQAP
jgi:hypothetical protein